MPTVRLASNSLAPSLLADFWHSLPVIADPWFYAAAVPAVLLMGLSKSGFASGFGSLAVPLMALSISVPQAAAVMLPLLLVMDATGLQQLWPHRDRALLRRLLPWALVGTLVGSLLFGVFPVHVVSGVVGALTLAFLAQRLLWPPRREGRPAPRWVGPLCAITSGFTSFVAHAGGPAINAHVLPMKLKPVVFSATMAVLFAALNLSKWVPYALLGLIDLRNMATSLLLLPLAPLGVWTGIWLTRRIDAGWFYRLAYLGMLLTGLKLLWDGLR